MRTTIPCLLLMVSAGSPALAEDKASQPYQGKPQSIPGILQAEHYDTGGEGVAYHDTDASNNGSGKLNLKFDQPEAAFRRDEGVDLSFTKEPHDKFKGDLTVDGQLEKPGALYLGWVEPGEWLRYTVHVAEAGTYRISGHVSGGRENATFSLESDQSNQTVTIPLPHTGSAHVWTTTEKLGEITLPAGHQVLTLRIQTEKGFNIDWLRFER